MPHSESRLPHCMGNRTDQHLDCRACVDATLQLGEADQAYIQQTYPTSLKNLRNLRDTLNADFQRKETIIEMMIICAIAQEPMLIFGPPGTAKSALVARFSELLGVRRYTLDDEATTNDGECQSFFEYLLTSFTEPDELFGPVIISSLVDKDRPRFERYRDGMLPNASVIFLDEIFRANSAILNTLLSLINERVVFEAGTAIRAATLVVFGASNNVPINEELRAFYERFPIRTYSAPVPPDERQELFDKSFRLERRRGRSSSQTPQACLADLAICNRAIMELAKPVPEFVDQYCEAVKMLRHREDLCQVDDRKLVKLYKVMCARALFLRDVLQPGPEDFDVLRHIWADFERRPLLNNLVDQIVKST
jgi:MoxR-like ATPase